ncbi:hypothetical protein [Glycomyces sp. NPDC047010]|uniref:hypothetical protein n=1 Tax=Glycomyces sp. NPDC047010 TaxID=3155023 RepID=UPI0033F6652B
MERLVRERRVVIADPDQSERGHWRKTIHYAKRYELVPEGEFIECTGSERGDLTIKLVAGAHPNAARKRAAALARVPVPQRLDRLHPVVARLRDDAGKLAMPKQLRHRSLLLLQALAAAAEERGWQVRDRSGEAELHYSGIRRQSEHRAGWIWVEVDGYSYQVTIAQEFPQTLDAVKSQLLKIKLPHTKSGSRCRWADRKTGQLEDRLPEVIDGLATRAAEDRERTSRYRHTATPSRSRSPRPIPLPRGWSRPLRGSNGPGDMPPRSIRSRPCRPCLLPLCLPPSNWHRI